MASDIRLLPNSRGLFEAKKTLWSVGIEPITCALEAGKYLILTVRDDRVDAARSALERDGFKVAD